MKTITGLIWKEALLSGANNLENKKNSINALNVFPVPDGDTGINMASTIQTAINSIKISSKQPLSEASKTIAQNMLMSARGNSGVILSQIFKGFANAFKDKEQANTFEIVQAFESAAKTAYQSVLKPIEGTILTVIREVAEGLKKEVYFETTVEEVFAIALKLARKSCDNTPNLLNVLKEVGVTDSGGEGLFSILEGLNSYFAGNPIIVINEDKKIDKFISDNEVFEGDFGYCTEFILELYKPHKFNKKSLIDKLEKIGNSMVVVNDEAILKVHIHTKKPGSVLSYVNYMGQFLKVKIDNMTLQANNSKENAKSVSEQKNTKNKIDINNAKADNQNKKELKECAIISCNSGQGISTLVKEYGATYIVEGGQTNNPSIADIIEAINNVDAKTIFILPNNSNIILSAQQAATIVRDKKVIIIPTKSQAQCLNILLNFSEENDVANNQELMNNALKNISYGEIAPSIKDTKLDGVKVKKGEYMVIVANKLKEVAKTYNEAAFKLIEKLVNDDTQTITIFYGEDVSEADAQELQNYIEVNYDIAIEIYNGGQNIYPYLICAE